MTVGASPSARDAARRRAITRREPERQLVDHQQPGPADEGHAEGEHLLLAPRQVAGRLLEPLTEDGEVPHDPFGGLGDLVVLAALEPAREPEVLGHRQ